MLYFKRLLVALAAALSIAACSSGGGAGTATITAENAQDLAVAGTEATRSAADSSDLSFFKSGASGAFDVKAFSKQVTQNLHAVEDLSFICDTGSYVITYPDDATQTNYTATATFTNCTISDFYTTATINGSIIINGSSSSVTISANLTVTEGSLTETFSFNGTCSVSGSTVGTCTYSSSFTGSDGRTYAMANISVSGDDFSGYSVSGSVTDPDHGVITITTTTPVLFNCSNGNPSSGQIVITGSGSATVTYNDCDSFTVTFDGAPTTYNWVDIQPQATQALPAAP